MLITLGGCLFSLTLEVIWGERVIWLAWTVAFLFGFFVSLMYPTGISWTSKYTNMSGRYIGVFSVGSALGVMLLLPASGAVFEIDAFYPMYLNLAVVICTSITFVLLVILKNSKYEINEPETLENKNALTYL